MSLPIPLPVVLTLLLLAGTVAAFATGRIRADLVAVVLLVLVALLGLVPVDRALAGFANPAVITVGAMFIISTALSRTGVADLVGARILRLTGRRETPLMVGLTLSAGVLSGFMNNVGVVAMMLPVTVELARRTGTPPSRLLIPMAVGAQLGGFTTLIGTSANLLASDALREAGREPFQLFSFTPMGAVLLAVGTLFVAFLGPRLLPVRVPADDGRPIRAEIREGVGLEERLFRLVVPEHSLLAGRTLGESLLGPALGLYVLAIERGGRQILAPGPGRSLEAGDRLVVQGRPEFFHELRGDRHLAPDGSGVRTAWLESEDVGLARAVLSPDSPLLARSVSDLDLRARYGFLLLGIRREGHRRLTHLGDTPLEAGDELLLQGPRERIEELAEQPGFSEVEPLDGDEAVERFRLEDRLWALRVTEASLLAGRTLRQTRLGEALGLVVLAVGRDEGPILLPGPDTELCPGDHLLVKTRPTDLAILRGLQRLEVDLDSPVEQGELEGREAGFVEAVLAPRSSLIGKTLTEAAFRSRFGLHVAAIVREGEVIRTKLRDERLRFGDALLLYGSKRKARALDSEPDLILLQEPEAEPPEPRLAPRSLVVVAGALVPVILGWVPVVVGVLAGAVAMVLTRCLSLDEAYRAVDWSTLALLAGMLALGAAMDESGTMQLLGDALLAWGGGLGPWALLALLAVATTLLAQIIPGAAVVVLMAPVAVAGAVQLGVTPEAMVLAVAVSATSLASPVSQPAQALVMAPAGYRPSDYVRLGVPMTLLVLGLTVLVAPLVFPF